jgi:hypothetical protein
MPQKYTHMYTTVYNYNINNIVHATMYDVHHVYTTGQATQQHFPERAGLIVVMYSGEQE